MRINSQLSSLKRSVGHVLIYFSQKTKKLGPIYVFSLIGNYNTNAQIRQSNKMDKSKFGKRYEGKVAIVTASTQGIGFSIAERLGLEGASVVVSSRKQVCGRGSPLNFRFFIHIFWFLRFNSSGVSQFQPNLVSLFLLLCFIVIDLKFLSFLLFWF